MVIVTVLLSQITSINKAATGIGEVDYVLFFYIYLEYF